MHAMDNYMHCLLTFCKLGMKDLDKSFRNNYGVLENGDVISIDTSSFIEDVSLQKPAVFKKEIILKSHNLAKWLRKNHSDLFTYYDQKLNDLIEQE